MGDLMIVILYLSSFTKNDDDGSLLFYMVIYDKTRTGPRAVKKVYVPLPFPFISLIL